MADERKDNRKKSVKKRRSRPHGTWWDNLNEGDKAWLYEHYK